MIEAYISHSANFFNVGAELMTLQMYFMLLLCSSLVIIKQKNFIRASLKNISLIVPLLPDPQNQQQKNTQQVLLLIIFEKLTCLFFISLNPSYPPHEFHSFHVSFVHECRTLLCAHAVKRPVDDALPIGSMH